MQTSQPVYPVPAGEPREPGLSPRLVPQRRKRRRLMIGAPVLAIAAIGAWAAVQRWLPAPGAASPAAGIRTTVVHGGTVQRILRLAGTTAAERTAVLMAPKLRGSRSRRGSQDFHLVLQGVVVGGAMVRQGDIVAEFDPLHMETRLDDFRAAVSQDERNIRKMYALLDVRRTALEQRIRATRGRMDKAALDLKTAPVRSAIVAERFRLTHAEAKAQLGELQRQRKLQEVSERAQIRFYELDVRESRLELQRAEANLDRMRVRAPIDGLTVLQQVRRGTEYGQVQAGDQLHPGEIFMQIVDLRSMVLYASVNQVDAERISPGQKALVHFDAYPGLELPAHVTAVGVYAKSAGLRREHLRQIDVRLRLDKTDPRVIPDSSASADIMLAQEQAAAVVPLECVFRDTATGRPYTWVLAGDAWEKREVEVGLASHILAAVSAGLRQGERIAVERPRIAGNGRMPLSVSPEEPQR